MKITLNELRRMVKHIISEMDSSVGYELKLPYLDWSGAGDQENFSKGEDMNRLVEVKELLEKALNYTIVGTMPYENEYQTEHIKGDKRKEGVFGKKRHTNREVQYVDRNDESKYEYSIFVEKGNNVHTIVVKYHEVKYYFDKNDYFKGSGENAEEFIFYGYRS